MAIAKRGPKNAHCRLTEDQEQKVIEAIRGYMPDQYKPGSVLWTRDSIAQLIKQFQGD
ncbi:hypothetical protein [Candidatus Vondammii sp. HM_W22]|uniref:hypothetical protein n=1 Tax=Candidatus Vondammii sp. HM_W22 TaxID=2687299 RepID=UPI00403DCA59